MVGDQDREPLLAEILDDLLDVMHGDRVHPAERLVQHEQGGIGDERAGDREAAFFPAGESQRLVLGDVVDPEPGEEFLAALFSLGLRGLRRLEDREDILLDGQLPENRFFLREVSHPVSRPAKHRHVRHVGIPENHAPAIRADQPDDHVKRGGFAGSVRAEKPDDFAFFHIDIDPVDDGAAVVDFHEPVGAEERGSFRDRLAVCELIAHFAAPASLVSVITVLLGPMVLDFPLRLRIMTVPFSVPTWLSIPDWIDGQSLSVASPDAGK